MKKFDPILEFQESRKVRIEQSSKDIELRKKSIEWMLEADRYKYTYNFEWCGIPIIKFPNDMIVFQELIWKLKPDIIIETGIAHGGSIIFSASLLELIGHGKVIGIDIEIRKHNLELLEGLELFKRIELIEDDSISKELHRYLEIETQGKSVVVVLDSMHTHDHVLNELNLFSKYINIDSYIVLPDTFIEFFPKNYYQNRPWDVGNNPWTALNEFLSSNPNFEVDTYFSNKALITESFNGYIARIN